MKNEGKEEKQQLADSVLERPENVTGRATAEARSKKTRSKTVAIRKGKRSNCPMMG